MPTSKVDYKSLISQAIALKADGDTDCKVGLTRDHRLVREVDLSGKKSTSFFKRSESFKSCQARLSEVFSGEVSKDSPSLKELLKLASLPSGAKEVRINSQTRYVDILQVPYPRHLLPGMSNKKADALQKLDYQVEIDDAEVAKKIQKANREAEDVGRLQNTGSSWFIKSNPKAEYPAENLSQIEGFKSGTIAKFPGAGYAHAQGRRATMEDADCVKAFTFKGDGKEISARLAGVFDGHAGSDASKLLKENLVTALTRRLEQHYQDSNPEKGIYNALRLAMVDLDRQVTRHGSTACVAVVINGRLWTVNVGDSRAVMINKDGSFTQLSKDVGFSDLIYTGQLADSAVGEHNPPITNLRDPGAADLTTDEAKDVFARGGDLALYRFSRVRSENEDSPKEERAQGYMVRANAITDGGVNMAYSIGDHNIHGVTPPIGVVTCHEVNENMGWVLIGCDGLFDAVPTAHHAQMIHNQVTADPNVSGQKLAEKSVEHAYYSGSMDNISSIVVPIESMSGL